MAQDPWLPKDAWKSAKAKKASLFGRLIKDYLSLSPFQISVIGSASSTLVGSLSTSRGRPAGTESPAAAAVDLSASFDIQEHVRRGMMMARSPSGEMVKKQEETGIGQKRVVCERVEATRDSYAPFQTSKDPPWRQRLLQSQRSATPAPATPRGAAASRAAESETLPPPPPLLLPATRKGALDTNRGLFRTGGARGGAGGAGP